MKSLKMDQIKKTCFLVIPLVVLTLGLFACSSSDESGVTDGPSVAPRPTTPGPAPGPAPGPTPSPTPGPEPSNKSIFMAVSEESSKNFVSYMSRDGVFGSDCEIPTGEFDQHIECLIDVIEQDLYFYGLGIEVNVPDEDCNYATFYPYWYYNFETGVGPESVALEIEKDAEGNNTSFQCAVNGEAMGDCSSLVEVVVDQTDDSLRCVYDTSHLDNGQNCCFGKYSLYKKVTTTDEEGNVTVDSSNEDGQDWGGSFPSCIGGGGSSHAGWSKFYSEGVPRSLIFDVPKGGVNRVFSFASNLSVFNNGSNRHLANYYKRDRNPHSHTGFVDKLRISNKPYPIEPIDDRDGTPMYSRPISIDDTTYFLGSGNDAYTLSCYDKGRELKHRINLFVREWNTLDEFLLYGDSSGAEGDPDIGGAEGVDCDFNPPSPLRPACNDRFDWLDFLTQATSSSGDSYDMSNVTNRAYYFPREIKEN